MELHLKPVLRHIELPSYQYNISVEPISYSSGTIVTGKIIIQIEILKCFVAIKTSLTPPLFIEVPVPSYVFVC
jgi:hypothetical protein